MGDRARMLKRLLLVVLSVFVIAVSARFDLPVPGSPVPQSAQTLAVLLVGLSLGVREGPLAIAAYLLVGALGAPVFADGASGWRHLIGPTSGYLVAFVVAATIVGGAERCDWLRRFGPAMVVMIGAHALILVLGWLRLSATIGFAQAYDQGLAPFVLGGIAKSLVAAGIAVVWTGYQGRRKRSSDRPSLSD